MDFSIYLRLHVIGAVNSILSVSYTHLLMTGVTAASAQQSSGDFFEGLSRKIGFSRMIPPHGLEITYAKTVHVIFPSPIKYVDLGSTNLIAGKADAAENVIRVKAAKKHFRDETNMSVITEDGNFYTFNVRYADEPLLLNVEMCDFIHDGETDVYKRQRISCWWTRATAIRDCVA